MDRALRVLLVEDEPVDVMTFRRAVRRRALDVDIIVADTAEAALELLRVPRDGGAAQAELPDLILADLRLPRLSGLDLLEQVKADDRLRRLPFVLLSTSTQASDLATAYSLGAAGYFAKSVDFEEFADTVATICDFWRRAQAPDLETAPAIAPSGHAEDHYLESELRRLLRDDRRVFDYLQSRATDGLWYWDLVHPEHRWMSAGFWRLFGYDPVAKPHLASAWQDMMNPDDRKAALANFEKHCADPEHPYDQVVRYRHRDGRWVWVHCRGIAIRDHDGRPIRMLGAHTDVSARVRAFEKLHRVEDTLRDADQQDPVVARLRALIAD